MMNQTAAYIEIPPKEGPDPINERQLKALSGRGAIFILLLLVGILIALGILFGTMQNLALGIICYSLSALCALIGLIGFSSLQPNEAMVLLFCGSYIGTIKSHGLFWVNPFYSSTKLSLRWVNQEGQVLKVNDKRGNPIQIAVIVVWRIQDTAKALFEVDKFEHFVLLQSESAVRHLANMYPYDEGENNEISLRSGSEQVNHDLLTELQVRTRKAGVEVHEARITHLAYSPEIAQAMLKKQQSEAVIAARQKIIQGAVSIVAATIEKLESTKVIKMSDDQKATMANNLLVVLCGETQVQPVMPTK
jgi:regulator of protease activity HflC (stomatin/prohibitin superfamily)